MLRNLCSSRPEVTCPHTAQSAERQTPMLWVVSANSDKGRSLPPSVPYKTRPTNSKDQVSTDYNTQENA